MKQTAVEWLVANIDWQLLRNTKTHYNMIVDKAKAMEKEQIVEAFNFGVYDGGGIIKKYKMSGEQYYNQTFKSE